MVSLENKVCLMLNVERSLLLIRFREELLQIDKQWHEPRQTTNVELFDLCFRRLHGCKVKLIFIYKICFPYIKINKFKWNVKIIITMCLNKHEITLNCFSSRGLTDFIWSLLLP